MERSILKKSIALLYAISLLCCCFAPIMSLAEKTDNIEWGRLQYRLKNSQYEKYGYNKNENAVACNKDIFAIVGGNGFIETSVDGFHWTERQSGVQANLNSILWNGVEFIAFSDSDAVKGENISLSHLPTASCGNR